MGRRFGQTRFDSAYNKVSEVMGALETEARCLTLEAKLECR